MGGYTCPMDGDHCDLELLRWIPPERSNNCLWHFADLALLATEWPPGLVQGFVAEAVDKVHSPDRLGGQGLGGGGLGSGGVVQASLPHCIRDEAAVCSTLGSDTGGGCLLTRVWLLPLLLLFP